MGRCTAPGSRRRRGGLPDRSRERTEGGGGGTRAAPVVGGLDAEGIAMTLGWEPVEEDDGRRGVGGWRRRGCMARDGEGQSERVVKARYRKTVRTPPGAYSFAPPRPWRPAHPCARHGLAAPAGASPDARPCGPRAWPPTGVQALHPEGRGGSIRDDARPDRAPSRLSRILEACDTISACVRRDSDRQAGVDAEYPGRRREAERRRLVVPDTEPGRARADMERRKTWKAARGRRGAARAVRG